MLDRIYPGAQDLLGGSPLSAALGSDDLSADAQDYLATQGAVTATFTIRDAKVIACAWDA